MNSSEKVQILFDMFQLVNFYYEERDRPSDRNIFEELEQHCQVLGVDAQEFMTKFGLSKVL